MITGSYLRLGDDSNFHVTTSGNFSASGYISGSGGRFTDTVRVAGDVYAQSFHTNNIVAATSTGSNVFGDTGDDIHRFTGSIQASGGNVYLNNVSMSIGFPSAVAPLYVLGDISASGELRSEGNADIGGYLNLRAQGANDGGEIRFQQGTNGTYENWVLDSYQNRIRFIYGSTELMTGNTSGNVGIGTTAPVAKLQVNGELGIHDGSGTVHTQMYREGTSGGITFKRVNNSDGSDNGGDFLFAKYGELRMVGSISASSHIRTNGNIYLDNAKELYFGSAEGTHNHQSGSIRKNAGGGLRIGNNVRIGGGSGVVKNLPDNSKVMGYPATAIKNFVKQMKY